MGRLSEPRGGVTRLEPGNSIAKPVERVCIMIMGRELCFTSIGEIPVTHTVTGPTGMQTKQFSLMVSKKGIYTNKREDT